MKNMKNLIKGSIFSKLILTFLLILLPLYLLGIGINKWGISTIKTEISNSVNAQMNYYGTTLQNEFVRFQKLEEEFMLDEDLSKLSKISETLSDYEKSQSINRLQDRLFLLKNSSSFIEDASVIIPSLDRTISVNNGVQPISADDLHTINSIPNGNTIELVNDNNELNSRLWNVSYSNKSTINFLLQIKISYNALQSTLDSFNIYNGEETLIYFPDQKYSISTDKNAQTTAELISNIVRHNKTTSNFMQSSNANNEKLIVRGEKFDFSQFWIVTYVPEKEVFSPLNKYLISLWLYTFVAVIIVIYFSFSTNKFLQRPLQKLVSAFKRVESGDLKISIKHDKNDEFQYIYTRFNAMLENINNLIEQVYTQKILSQKAELKQLQSQINPHFLYNSFFILQRMIQCEDNENATKFCGYLGKYFQYVTRNAQDNIPLSLEVEHARNYLEIQAIRFSNTKIIFEELPAKYKNLIVPRLILQPFIENTFEHGFNKSIKQAMILIQFVENSRGLNIIIEDNGNIADDIDIQKINQALNSYDGQESENTGLINTNKRIKLQFGDNSGISISQGGYGGWKVTIFFEIEG